MFGQSGSKSKSSNRKFLTKRDTTEPPPGFLLSLTETETFRMCFGPDVVDCAVAVLSEDKERSMLPRLHMTTASSRSDSQIANCHIVPLKRAIIPRGTSICRHAGVNSGKFSGSLTTTGFRVKALPGS